MHSSPHLQPQIESGHQYQHQSDRLWISCHYYSCLAGVAVSCRPAACRQTSNAPRCYLQSICNLQCRTTSCGIFSFYLFPELLLSLFSSSPDVFGDHNDPRHKNAGPVRAPLILQNEKDESYEWYIFGISIRRN